MPANKLIKTKINARTWTSIVAFGLIGQIAWAIENMYLNVFMDRTVTRNPIAIAVMIGASAVIATFTTLLIGIYSDKRGGRKDLICLGYIAWGVTVLFFSSVSVENTMKLFKNSQTIAITATVGIIVLLDATMEAFGSAANDSAFNAWVSDISDDSNRGTVQGILSFMPLLSITIVFGAFDPFTKNTYKYLDGSTGSVWQKGAVLLNHGDWHIFFIAIGTVMILVATLGLFILKDSQKLKPNHNISYKDIIYGFKKKIKISISFCVH